MQFTKLKITGFKSFVEPVEFPIATGLTGIVGPNGCGKSNVVEALRWGMGENSAKRLRGSEMDDVIFAGSAGRPARNLAEVMLVLDNRQRTALAEFNSDDEMEITRRIERGMGSDYRINGRPVRQKDVQLLFADQATGAHSTSIVSQGKVSALISAKPEERRQVLEEAAGVSGLHARRHEAELKLKAAETNLARVGDQLQLMDQQLRGLKTQVRQTSRYRNLGDLIRKAEAGILYLKIRAAEAALHAAEAAFAQSETQVRELTSGVARASAAATESASTLAPLRQGEAAASAVVQRLHLERETLEREAKRISEAQATNARRVKEVQSDRAREQKLGEEARGALARLSEEKAETEAHLKTLEGEGGGLESRVAAARALTATQERIFQEKTRDFAETSARAQSLAREAEALNTRHAAVEARLKEIQAAADAAQGQARAVDPSLAKVMAVEAEAALAQKQDAVKSAQESRRATEEKLNEMRARRETVQSEKARLEAEIEALRAFLHGAEGKPLADQLGVEKAYQAALAAALGEGLLASLDSSAKTFWQDLGGFGFLGTAGLPRFASPLLNHVKDVPAALKRALSHAGIVENFETGERLAQELKPGQILVSLEGDSWRWDGYTQRHDAETPAAARLRHHARLKEAEAALATVQPRVNTAEENFRQADQDYQVAQTGAMQAEAAQQQAFSSLYEARERYAEKARERGEIETRISGLGENLAAARAEETGILGEAENIETQRQALPPLPGLQESLEAARKILAEQRDRLVEVEAAQAGYHGKLESMRARLAHMEESAQSWAARAETGARHLQDLAARLSGLEEEGQALALRPAEIDAERQALLSKSAKAEDNRVMAADALIKAEQKQARLDKEARAAEEALMQAKESRVRFEEQMFRAKSGFDELALRIREHWHGTPEELPAKAGLDTEKLEALEEIEDNLARYNRERENMGPVNLRAEIEADEIQAQIDRITAEKSDLEGAIAKLRQGISTLNREARERLATAFADVDKNFGSLFERLFGGGRAHLKLIESDDPLEAGLEIYASPPGKRLQILSLLSGGEQALTALALLFAIFLVNPSPICVLDEVDAPLDEANVDRFCTLVREMAEQGKTRFLIVTHHRLTMARMDRLFGVTMAEKGVSQLVSVDLKQALALREQGGEGEFETAAA